MVFSKNAEVQAAQEKFDNLTSQIAKQTKRLLAEQEERLVAVKVKIEIDIADCKAVLNGVKSAITDHQVREKALQLSIHELEGDEKVLQEQIKSERTTLADLQAEAEQTATLIKTFEIKEHAIEVAISKKTADLDKLNADIQSREAMVDELQHKLDGVEVDYAKKIADKEAIVAELDAKVIENTQAMKKFEQEEAFTRQEFASWQKRLEQRDQNIRIRELKVEQGEGKLVHNANLLNL